MQWHAGQIDQGRIYIWNWSRRRSWALLKSKYGQTEKAAFPTGFWYGRARSLHVWARDHQNQYIYLTIEARVELQHLWTDSLITRYRKPIKQNRYPIQQSILILNTVKPSAHLRPCKAGLSTDSPALKDEPKRSQLFTRTWESPTLRWISINITTKTFRRVLITVRLTNNSKEWSCMRRTNDAGNQE